MSIVGTIMIHSSLSIHLFLKGMALITTTWYKAASAAPMNGPTQKIHCNNQGKSQLTSKYQIALKIIYWEIELNQLMRN